MQVTPEIGFIFDRGSAWENLMSIFNGVVFGITLVFTVEFIVRTADLINCCILFAFLYRNT